MSNKYTNPAKRFLRCEIGDLFWTIGDVDTRRYEAELNNALEADVNAAVAAVIDGMQVLPTDLPATVALKVEGDGRADGFVRLVSAQDVLRDLDGREDAAGIRAALADRLEEMAREMRYQGADDTAPHPGASMRDLGGSRP